MSRPGLDGALGDPNSRARPEGRRLPAALCTSAGWAGGPTGVGPGQGRGTGQPGSATLLLQGTEIGLARLGQPASSPGSRPDPALPPSVAEMSMPSPLPTAYLGAASCPALLHTAERGAPQRLKSWRKDPETAQSLHTNPSGRHLHTRDPASSACASGLSSSPARLPLRAPVLCTLGPPRIQRELLGGRREGAGGGPRCP
ncbi:hypothetical protein HPG69_011550 [Diceros bicornis minor]|uniref:Uncharacterized protein n=1 Tax=Diceros bicornis minor TaxID=77932 RepID=A0A7J7EJ71_DICBM|nr:hypothetical protein HPG69_011550 [Diceros bicornis minor]